MHFSIMKRIAHVHTQVVICRVVPPRPAFSPDKGLASTPDPTLLRLPRAKSSAFNSSLPVPSSAKPCRWQQASSGASTGQGGRIQPLPWTRPSLTYHDRAG